MKKSIIFALVALFVLSCAFDTGSSESSSNVIKVGATPEPHAAMLNLVK